MAAVGNLNDYVKYQMAQGFEKGGGGAGGVGAEMAVGMAMAQQMMNQPGGIMAQSTPGIAAPPPTARRAPSCSRLRRSRRRLGVSESDVDREPRGRRSQGQAHRHAMARDARGGRRVPQGLAWQGVAAGARGCARSRDRAARVRSSPAFARRIRAPAPSRSAAARDWLALVDRGDVAASYDARGRERFRKAMSDEEWAVALRSGARAARRARRSALYPDDIRHAGLPGVGREGEFALARVPHGVREPARRAARP